MTLRPLLIAAVFMANVSTQVFADQIFNVTVRGRAISGISIAPSDQVDGDDCDKIKIGSMDGFTCKVVLADEKDNLKDYKIGIQGDGLFFPFPILLRVFPTNRKPIRIDIDLSDPVFSKDFAPSRKYYLQWNSLNPKISDDNLNFYLVTRNYYAALSESPDKATAWVLHEWLRRGAYLTEHVPYISLDPNAIAEVRKFQDSLTGPQLQIFTQFGPKLTSPTGPTDFQRMQIANWSLYRVLGDVKVPPSAQFPASLCNLFDYFKAEWASASDRQSVITSVWHVNSETLAQDGTKTYLVRCSSS